jgi:hypothetical protein
MDSMLALRSVILPGHLGLHWLRACAAAVGKESSFMTFLWIEAYARKMLRSKLPQIAMGNAGSSLGRPKGLPCSMPCSLYAQSS